MPLKKPKSVPKIAKARIKTIDKMKETVPVKKEAEREYNCKIAFKFNPLKKVQQYSFALETEKLFSSMNYGITTETKKDIKKAKKRNQNNYQNGALRFAFQNSFY